MDSGRLTRTVGIVALGRAASTFSVLAVWGILARPWSQSQLGVFLAVWTAGNTLAPMFLLGLPTALLYFYPRRDAFGQRRLVLQAVLLLLGSATLLVALVMTFGSGLVLWLHPSGLAGLPELAPYLLSFAPYLFALVGGGFIESALVAANKPQWQAGLAIASAIGLLLVAGTVAYLGAGVVRALWGFSLVGMARLATGSWMVHAATRTHGGGGSVAGGVIALARYAAPIWLTDTVGSMSRYVDRIVVLWFFAAGVFPQYQLGAVEVPIGLLLSAVVTVLVPEVSRLYATGRLAQIGELWRAAVGRLALLVLPVFTFLLVFADPLVTLYATEQYGPARWVFRIFLLALPLRCAVYNPLLVGMGKARWALWGSLGDLLLNAVLSVALVRYLLGVGSDWAFLGAAVGTVTATYVQVGFLVGAIGWHLRWRPAQLLPWARLLRLAVFSGLAGGVAWLTAGGLSAQLWQLCCGGVVFAATLGAMLCLSPWERQDLARILASLRRGEHGDG